MINCTSRPAIIIKSVFAHAHIKTHERKYITENLEKPLEISMIVYRKNHTVQSVSMPFGEMSTITLGADDMDAEVKFI